jgi:hypothetical protein
MNTMNGTTNGLASAPRTNDGSPKMPAGHEPDGASANTSPPASEAGSITDRGPEESPRKTMSMKQALAAITRAKTRALVFEHLGHLAAREFLECDTRPRLLVRTREGGAVPADQETIVEIEAQLAQLASDEREILTRLLACETLVELETADPTATAHDSSIREPEADALIESAACVRSTTTAKRPETKRSTSPPEWVPKAAPKAGG